MSYSGFRRPSSRLPFKVSFSRFILDKIWIFYMRWTQIHNFITFSILCPCFFLPFFFIPTDFSCAWHSDRRRRKIKAAKLYGIEIIGNFTFKRCCFSSLKDNLSYYLLKRVKSPVEYWGTKYTNVDYENWFSYLKINLSLYKEPLSTHLLVSSQLVSTVR